MNTRSIVLAAIGGAALVAIPTTVAVAMNTSDDTRPGIGDPAALVSEGDTLSSVDTASLAYMVNEEKFAHDLYVELADAWDLRVFENISSAEQQHMDAIRSLLDAYSEDDPTDGLAAGEFSEPALQDLYDTLLAEGLESASENHLRAFVMNLDRAGVGYEAQVLSDSEVSGITAR